MKKFLELLIVFLTLPQILCASQHAQIILEATSCSQHTNIWDYDFQVSTRSIGDTVRLYGGGGATNYKLYKLAIVRAPIRLVVIDPGSYNDSSGAIKVSPVDYDSLLDTTIHYTGELTGLDYFLNQVGVMVNDSVENTIFYTKGDTILFPDSFPAYLLKFYTENAPYGNPTLVLVPALGIEEVGDSQGKNIRFGPNPFLKLIRFETDKPIEIFDVSGRLIRRLSDEEKVWNGKDENGRETPFGVYFCKFRPGLKLSKIVKLK